MIKEESIAHVESTSPSFWNTFSFFRGERGIGWGWWWRRGWDIVLFSLNVVAGEYSSYCLLSSIICVLVQNPKSHWHPECTWHNTRTPAPPSIPWLLTSAGQRRTWQTAFWVTTGSHTGRRGVRTERKWLKSLAQLGISFWHHSPHHRLTSSRWICDLRVAMILIWWRSVLSLRCNRQWKAFKTRWLVPSKMLLPGRNLSSNNYKERG